MSIEISIPSVDRPFGIYLWSVFTTLTKLAGWDASQFEFVQGELPLSTTKEVIIAIVVYYVVIFGGREVMRPFNAIPAKFMFQVHNFTLTAISLLLFLLLVEQLFPIVVRHGILYGICNAGSWTQPIVTAYYLNYLTKYLEFVDTVYLVIKKKPLTFLHTYHHGATALLCYTQLIGRTSVSWVPIVLNLFVHVVMYWYYFLAARGIRVWWKEWITRIQIIQFVIDLFFVYFASYTYFTSTYFQWMPNMGSCAGEEFAAVYGCALLTSYLVLFIAFYIRVYVKGKKRAGQTRARRNTGAKIVDAARLAESVAEEMSAESTGIRDSPAATTVKSRKA